MKYGEYSPGPDALALPYGQVTDFHTPSNAGASVQSLANASDAQDALAARAPAKTGAFGGLGNWLSVAHNSLNPFKRRGG